MSQKDKTPALDIRAGRWGGRAPSRHLPPRHNAEGVSWLIKHGAVAAEIIRGAKNFAAYVDQENTDPRYVPQATTWLNQERWEGYQDAPAKPQPREMGPL